MLAQKLMGANGPAGGSGVLEFVGASSKSQVSTTVTCNTPANAQIGDLLVAVGVSGTGPLNSYPSGWSFPFSNTQRTLFFGAHDGSATYTFGNTFNVLKGVVLLCFRGADFGVYAAAMGAGETDPSAVDVAVVDPDSLLIGWASAISSGNTYSPPTGWTTVIQETAAVSISVAIKDTLVPAGSVGATTFTRTAGSSTLGRAHQFSVSPA